MRVESEHLKKADDHRVIGKKKFGYYDYSNNPHIGSPVEEPLKRWAYGCGWKGETFHYSWGKINAYTPIGKPNISFVEGEDGFFTPSEI